MKQKLIINRKFSKFTQQQYKNFKITGISSTMKANQKTTNHFFGVRKHNNIIYKG